MSPKNTDQFFYHYYYSRYIYLKKNNIIMLKEFLTSIMNKSNLFHVFEID